MNNQVFLIKFIDKEYLKSFLDGEIYFPLLKTFWDIEIKEEDKIRGDIYEGYFSKLLPKGTKVSIKQEENDEWFDFPITDIVQTKLKGEYGYLPIACFSLIKVEELFLPIKNNKVIINPNIIEELKKIKGKREMVIISKEAFLKKIKNQSEIDGLKNVSKRVDYYNHLKDSNIKEEEFEKGSLEVVFSKRLEYEYQREFRLLYDNKIYTENQVLKIGDIRDITISLENIPLNKMKLEYITEDKIGNPKIFHLKR
ncbi:hypothetical protein [Carnobacterium antarcticum]|uniref:S1 motif domain-containing protein n=1 Tax=Carnobacterium antarcticum TaxID=2126436 RepID=A0ABW4NMZ4_9LACT|nr:hypothetical protein [Carnobacterium sp. CP1]ALV21079.1 hypothetical protein NY10_459 [Carnobacterium sp. CP1]